MRPLIYVVDDDPLVCDLMALHLKTYDVQCATSGVDALWALKRIRPALLLLDIDMPGMTGLQVLEALRKHPTHMHTPVMMMTARKGSAAVREAMAAGANGYLVKPFSRDQLMARVKQLANQDEISWLTI